MDHPVDKKTTEASTRISASARRDAGNQKTPGTSKSLQALAGGITTSIHFASVMAAIMDDVLNSRINPNVANAAVNAGGKLLKVKEMELRFGTVLNEEGDKVLKLTS